MNNEENIEKNYNGFKRIRIKNNNVLNPELSGKTIKDIVLTYKAYDERDNRLVITFTDNTFLSFGISQTEKDDCEYYYITQKHLPTNDDIKNFAYAYIYKDNNSDELKFYPYMQVLIDMGLYKFTIDDAKKAKQQIKEKEEEREYEQYLRLKEKFEHVDSQK